MLCHAWINLYEMDSPGLGNKLTKEKILFYIFGKMRRNRLFIIGQTGEAKSDLCK